MKTKITIQIPIEIAETLQGLIDGCIGTSGDDCFSEQMKKFLSALDEKVNNYYLNKNKTK